MSRVRFIRHGPGFYETPDGRFALSRSEWRGPRGGRRTLWEIATPDALGRWTVGNYPPAETKREAEATLAILLEAA